MDLDYDHNDFEQHKRSELDDRLLVKFFVKQRPDAKASDEAGHPVFKDVEYIDIRVPGSNSGGACRPARTSDVERFPRHYAAFKQRQEMPVEGTPLSEWPAITRSFAETLAFFNVKTVEQLADAPDNHIGGIRGAATFKRKAQEWLASAKGNAALKKVEEQDAQIEDLKRQIEELKALVGSGEAKAAAPEPKPRARRRRRATQAEDA